MEKPQLLINWKDVLDIAIQGHNSIELYYYFTWGRKESLSIFNNTFHINAFEYTVQSFSWQMLHFVYEYNM